MKHQLESDVSCLQCGYRFEVASNIEGDGPPEAGSVSICIHCGHAAIFTAAGRLREPRLMERVSLAEDPGVQEAQAAVRALHHGYGTGRG